MKTASYTIQPMERAFDAFRIREKAASHKSTASKDR
jgi:hypothetical protein